MCNVPPVAQQELIAIPPVCCSAEMVCRIENENQFHTSVNSADLIKHLITCRKNRTEYSHLFSCVCQSALTSFFPSAPQSQFTNMLLAHFFRFMLFMHLCPILHPLYYSPPNMHRFSAPAYFFTITLALPFYSFQTCLRFVSDINLKLQLLSLLYNW